MEEIWKEYKTYGTNCYGDKCYVKSDIEVSNFGNVRGTKWNNKPLNEVFIKDNRRRISNSHDGQIFVLVWTVFNGPLPKGYVIHHKDFNSLNDRLDNLVIMTISEHIRLHRLRNREQNKKIKESLELYRKEHPELNDKISKSIKEYYKNNPDASQTISKRMKGNKSLSGRKWYNNGFVQKPILIGEQIPDGFVPGRLKKKQKQ